jgi:hypothetical protein
MAVAVLAATTVGGGGGGGCRLDGRRRQWGRLGSVEHLPEHLFVGIRLFLFNLIIFFN